MCAHKNVGETVDLVLVRPTDQARIYGVLSGNLAAVEPPIWAALFAAYARDRGFSVKIIDTEADVLTPEQTAQRIREMSPRLVGMIVIGNNLSASTWNMCGASDYHRVIKEAVPGAATFFWGLHSSALPERTLVEERPDYVIEGEGFDAIVGLLNILKSGSLDEAAGVPGVWCLVGDEIHVGERSPVVKDLDELPVPAWDSLPMEKYRAHNWQCFDDMSRRQPYGVIYTSLGCPFHCSFCSLNKMFTGRPGVRFRSADRVIEDLRPLVETYGVRNIKVLDECFAMKKSHVKAICDAIVAEGWELNIWAYARVDTVDEEMLCTMRQAGVQWIAYGIEPAAKDVLSGVAKGRYGSDEIRDVIRITKEAGIHIVGNFMFGLPDDTIETMRESLDLAKELQCEYANFYVTMAYPGSELYVEALRDGVRLPETWRGFSQFSRETLPLPTKHLTAEGVLRFRDAAFDEYYSDPTYLEMMRETFGDEAVKAVRDMSGHSIERDILNEING